MTFLNITIGEKEFDEIKEGKVGLVCLPCTHVGVIPLSRV